MDGECDEWIFGMDFVKKTDSGFMTTNLDMGEVL